MISNDEDYIKYYEQTKEEISYKSRYIKGIFIKAVTFNQLFFIF